MTARVLVVDDVASNVMLLEAQLSAQYLQVQTASNGHDALRIIESDPPDIVLLDVMMPGINGYEVCRRVRQMPNAASLPIVMVTALNRPDDRIAGLEAGADDFLTKPVNEAVLLARVRNLVRLKLLTDEMQLRQTTAQGVDAPDPISCLATPDPSGRILVVEDREDTLAMLANTLTHHQLAMVRDTESAIALVNDRDFDLAMVSLTMRNFDGLRLCARLRATTKGRHLPLLVLTREDEPELARAFELGVNDCVTRPIDRSEMLARVKWLLRKKRYADQPLLESITLSLNMATTDPLTGLYNRHIMDRHLDLLIEKANGTGEPLTLMMFDIDHFKRVNDEHGHDVGDEVLRAFACRLSEGVRNADLICRFGEEFVVLMRNTSIEQAHAVAERVRARLESTPIVVGQENAELNVTVSVGLATAAGRSDTAETIFHRADQALYKAKRTGRNRVCEDELAA